jgi:hypothetical protein
LKPKGRLASLDNSIDAVKKLIHVIQIKLRRCVPSIETYGQKLSHQAIVTKRTFGEVKTLYVDGRIQFHAYPYCTDEKEFDISALIELPAELKIVHCTTSKSGLINYNDVFEKSLLLHDSVLQPFMACFKCHLISVQACLTSIEEWLNATETNQRFLESTFGYGVVKASLRKSTKDPICGNCRSCFKQHQAAPYLQTSSSRFLCPVGMKFFKRSDALLLKEFTTSCQVNDSFDLFNNADRVRLSGLVNFVSSL